MVFFINILRIINYMTINLKLPPRVTIPTDHPMDDRQILHHILLTAIQNASHDIDKALKHLTDEQREAIINATKESESDTTPGEFLATQCRMIATTYLASTTDLLSITQSEDKKDISQPILSIATSNLSELLGENLGLEVVKTITYHVEQVLEDDFGITRPEQPNLG